LGDEVKIGLAVHLAVVAGKGLLDLAHPEL
jgi:hypothetical protein